MSITHAVAVVEVEASGFKRLEVREVEKVVKRVMKSVASLKSLSNVHVII